MSLPNSSARYSGVAMAFHWVLAVALGALFAVGLYMADLPFSPQRIRLFNWHKWAGITILVLSALRLLWRLTHRPPASLPAPAWQQLAAKLTHNTLYVLFFAVPLVGWAYSSAAGFPVVWMGVVPLPDWIGPNKIWAEAIKPWHGALAWGLAGLVAVHVAAALKHHLVDHNGLLLRMWPLWLLRATRQKGKTP
jgi:cytochrome b561